MVEIVKDDEGGYQFCIGDKVLGQYKDADMMAVHMASLLEERHFHGCRSVVKYYRPMPIRLKNDNR